MSNPFNFSQPSGGILAINLPDSASNESVNLQPGTMATETDTKMLGTPTINGANVSAFGKNYIINGGFDYWNYATSQTSSGYGSDDRWGNGNIGSTKTHSMVNATDTERALFNSSKFSRTAVTSVAGVGNYAIKLQKIENITKLAGKTVTLSFWAKADSSKNIAIEFYQEFGTGGTPSTAISGIGSQLVALTTTWQKKTITVAIPSIVGKTLGTDGVHTTSAQLVFWFDAGSNFNTRTASLGQQSGTFDIAEVKLEEGSVATPWTPYEGEFGGEVQACQRYYEECTMYGTYRYWAGSNSSNYAAGTYMYKAKKRVLPTITFNTPTYTNCSALVTLSNQLDMHNATVTATAAGVYSCSYGFTASAEL